MQVYGISDVVEILLVLDCTCNTAQNVVTWDTCMDSVTRRSFQRKTYVPPLCPNPLLILLFFTYNPEKYIPTDILNKNQYIPTDILKYHMFQLEKVMDHGGPNPKFFKTAILNINQGP